MGLDSVAPTEAPLSMDGCQIVVVEGGILVRDILFGHLGDVTLHILHLDKHQLRVRTTGETAGGTIEQGNIQATYCNKYVVML